jgi:hypothetical protein
MSQEYDDARTAAETFATTRTPDKGVMNAYYSERKFSDAHIQSMKSSAVTSGDTLAEDLCDKLLLVHTGYRRNIMSRTRKYFEV